MTVRVRGCGCRFRMIDKGERCEYLCSDHQNQFILTLFNSQLEIKQMKEKGWNGV